MMKSTRSSPLDLICGAHVTCFKLGGGFKRLKPMKIRSAVWFGTESCRKPLAVRERVMCTVKV